MKSLSKYRSREIQVHYKRHTVPQEAVERKGPLAPWIATLFSDLQYATKEKFLAVSLDENLQIKCFEVVAVGSVNAIYLRPMEVFRTPLIVNAAAVVLVHNHPSGEPDPSREDLLFTEKCRRIAEDLGVRLLDHVIIGYKSWYSFAAEGRM